MTRLLLVVAAIGLSVASCDQAPRNKPATAAVGAVQLASSFASKRCWTPAPYVAPRVGAVITGRMSSGAAGTESQTRVVAIDGAKVTVDTQFQTAGLAPYGRARIYELGFLPGGNPGTTTRTLEYSGNPEVQVAGLNVGDDIDLSVLETATGPSGSRTWSHKFNVKLLACGDLTWAEGTTPVRVYQTTVYNGSIEPGASPDQTDRTTMVSYVSEQHGWFLRRDYPSGGHDETLRFTPPR